MYPFRYPLSQYGGVTVWAEPGVRRRNLRAWSHRRCPLRHRVVDDRSSREQAVHVDPLADDYAILVVVTHVREDDEKGNAWDGERSVGWKLLDDLLHEGCSNDGKVGRSRGNRRRQLDTWFADRLRAYGRCEAWSRWLIVGEEGEEVEERTAVVADVCARGSRDASEQEQHRRCVVAERVDPCELAG
ncbi:hypothetical protein ABG067_003804 [Albugo candida]